MGQMRVGRNSQGGASRSVVESMAGERGLALKESAMEDEKPH